MKPLSPSSFILLCSIVCTAIAQAPSGRTSWISVVHNPVLTAVLPASTSWIRVVHNPVLTAVSPASTSWISTVETPTQAATDQRERDRWNYTLIRSVREYRDPTTNASLTVTPGEKFALEPLLATPVNPTRTSPFPIPYPSHSAPGRTDFRPLYLSRPAGGALHPSIRPDYALPFWWAPGNDGRLFVQVEADRTGQLQLWKDRRGGQSLIAGNELHVGVDDVTVPRWKFNDAGHLVSRSDSVEPEWMLCFGVLEHVPSGQSWNLFYTIGVNPSLLSWRLERCEKLHLVKVPLPNL
ncbi:MAG: hypothetical protein M1832_003706 [Thelocarpon impressellum]|nr:MAG: hypothetical protein M1832_003706 [Thelocarpon impressellum]